MNSLKRLALAAGALLAFGPVEAQYTFGMQIVVSGNCFSSSSNIAERNYRQLINEYNARLKAIPLTKEECMAMRQQIASETTITYNEYGCSIKLVITPCSCAGCNDEATGRPDQGGSFNSANAGSEVNDWMDDTDERRMALDRLSKAPVPSQVEEFFGKGTGDKSFDDAVRRSLETFQLPNNEVKLPDDFELLANMENVQRYMDSTNNLAALYINNPYLHLTELFQNEFSRVSNFNIGEIMNKLPSQRSESEKQALFDYQLYRRKLADNMMKYVIAVQEETRAYEMAVLSDDCYGDSEHQFIGTTNYQAVNKAEIDDPKMREWAEFIERCNDYDPGFNAILYKNKVTGEYTLAFEGSNLHPIENWEGFKADWKDCNFKQGFGDIPMLYLLAKVIADKMPKDVQINLTGHSLGGGLASVAGAIAGAPTYTYNPEGVNNRIIDAFGMRGQVDAGVNNIKAYQANNDLLTSLQEGILKDVVLGVVKIIDPVRGIQLSQEKKEGNVLSSAIGCKETIKSGGWHKIKPMIQYFDIEQGKMNEHANYLLNSINNAGYGTEQQTEDHILIIMPE